VKKYANNLKSITIKQGFVDIKTVMTYNPYGTKRLKNVRDALRRLLCIIVAKNSVSNVPNKSPSGTSQAKDANNVKKTNRFITPIKESVKRVIRILLSSTKLHKSVNNVLNLLQFTIQL